MKKMCKYVNILCFFARWFFQTSVSTTPLTGFCIHPCCSHPIVVALRSYDHLKSLSLKSGVVSEWCFFLVAIWIEWLVFTLDSWVTLLTGFFLVDYEYSKCQFWFVKRMETTTNVSVSFSCVVSCEKQGEAGRRYMCVPPLCVCSDC